MWEGNSGETCFNNKQVAHETAGMTFISADEQTAAGSVTQAVVMLSENLPVSKVN